MKLLDAVNLVMPKLGERPVTSLDVKHPTLAVLLPIITQNRKTTLGTGWWFNCYDYKAMPDMQGNITLGSDTLSFVPKYSDKYATRGLRLFNTSTLSFLFTEAVEGRITQDVVFDELPESCANYVFYSSLVEAYATDLGLDQTLQMWQSLAGRSWSDFIAEHLRQKKYNTRRQGAWRRLIGAMNT